MDTKISDTPFTKYGHDCTLDELPDEFEYNGVTNEFRRWLIRLCVVSESSKMYTHHLRSFDAIVKERRRQVLNYGFRIHPFSRAYLIWSFIMIVAIVVRIFCAGLEFLFHDNTLRISMVYSTYWMSFACVFDVIFMLNVFLCFFTGYYDEPKQEVILDFNQIALQYLKTFFIVDFLVCYPSFVHMSLEDESGPFQWIIHTLYSMKQYLKTFFIVDFLVCYPSFVHMSLEDESGLFQWIIHTLYSMKFLLIFRFYKHFKYCAEILDVDYYTYMISLVVVVTLLYWHVVCCMLTFLRQHLSSEDNTMFKGEQTMVRQLRIQANSDYPALYRFIGAYYGGSLIICNSGYGKVMPATKNEILVVWFGWYASSLFFIYILAMIMEILKGKTSASHKYVEMERQLKDYMRHKQLPMQMRCRILIYYEFRFQKSYFRENEILETISEQLRQEINMHACRKLVENVIFFKNLPINLLVRIISCLRIEVYLVNDVIIKANTPGNSMYFISTGTVAIYTKSGKEICHLEDGSHFGEIALIIKGTLRTASVIAVEVSEIYRLDQKDFVKAINPYPDLLANILHIAAERMEVASMLDEYNKKEHSTKK